jgi:hypothetical protein
VPSQIVIPKHIAVVLTLIYIIPATTLVEGLTQPGARKTALIADDPY